MIVYYYKIYDILVRGHNTNEIRLHYNTQTDLLFFLLALFTFIPQSPKKSTSYSIYLDLSVLILQLCQHLAAIPLEMMLNSLECDMVSSCLCYLPEMILSLNNLFCYIPTEVIHLSVSAFSAISMVMH